MTTFIIIKQLLQFSVLIKIGVETNFHLFFLIH